MALKIKWVGLLISTVDVVILCIAWPIVAEREMIWVGILTVFASIMIR